MAHNQSPLRTRSCASLHVSSVRTEPYRKKWQGDSKKGGGRVQCLLRCTERANSDFNRDTFQSDNGTRLRSQKAGQHGQLARREKADLREMVRTNQRHSTYIST
jgi:hypothetical protein